MLQRCSPAGCELVAPREARLLEAAAGRVLPLGLGRAAARRPSGSRRGRRSRRRGRRGGPGRSSIEDVRPFGVPPVGAEHLTPPRRLREPPGGRELVRQQPGEHEGPAEPLGLGDVAGGVDEGGEAGVGDGDRVDPERPQGRPRGPGLRRPPGSPRRRRCPSGTRRRPAGPCRRRRRPGRRERPGRGRPAHAGTSTGRSTSGAPRRSHADAGTSRSRSRHPAGMRPPEAQGSGCSGLRTAPARRGRRRREPGPTARVRTRRRPSEPLPPDRRCRCSSGPRPGP